MQKKLAEEEKKGCHKTIYNLKQQKCTDNFIHILSIYFEFYTFPFL